MECAEFYGNESEVGKAIKSSEIARKELFLCNKVCTATIEKGDEAISARLDQTLCDLGTDYVDFYLIHRPVPGNIWIFTNHWKSYKRRERSVSLLYQIMSWMIARNKELIHAAVTMEPVAKNTIDYFQKGGDVMYLA